MSSGGPRTPCSLSHFLLGVNWSRPMTCSTTNHNFYKALGRLRGPWCKHVIGTWFGKLKFHLMELNYQPWEIYCSLLGPCPLQIRMCSPICKKPCYMIGYIYNCCMGERGSWRHCMVSLFFVMYVCVSLSVAFSFLFFLHEFDMPPPEHMRQLTT